MAEGLALVDIRQMDFDDRQVAGLQRVMDGDRGMRIGGGIEHDAAAPSARLLDPGDELALDIALPEVDVEAEPRPRPGAALLDVAERLAAIDRRARAVPSMLRLGPFSTKTGFMRRNQPRSERSFASL